MTDLLQITETGVCTLTLNRLAKHNAFDDQLIAALQSALDQAIADPTVRLILLKANGPHFSAGADLQWMQRMATYSEQENQADALRLATLLYTLYTCPKPTLASVQGRTFGGGVGLIAACDIVIASDEAQFCFSEVKLGLIPAVISPYVVKAIGERRATFLFISAETFDAEKAATFGLVHKVVPATQRLDLTNQYLQKLLQLAPLAMRESKKRVREVASTPIDAALMEKTATWIAQKRISAEGQQGLSAFLNQQIPVWDQRTEPDDH